MTVWNCCVCGGGRFSFTSKTVLFTAMLALRPALH